MAKINPLHTTEMLIDNLRHHGVSFDITRGTGRSTSLAFRQIHEAMHKPHTWLRVYDHSCKRSGEVLTWRYIQSIVQGLGMSHFRFKAEGTSYYVAFGVPDAA